MEREVALASIPETLRDRVVALVVANAIETALAEAADAPAFAPPIVSSEPTTAALDETAPLLAEAGAVVTSGRPRTDGYRGTTEVHPVVGALLRRGWNRSPRTSRAAGSSLSADAAVPRARTRRGRLACTR